MYDGLSDSRAYYNTIGCLMKDYSLIDDISRPLDRSDFNTGKFYEIIYVAIYNLAINGCESIDEFAIDSYLSNYKDQYKEFQQNNGLEYLVQAREISSVENYDYYYHRLRKFSLLRYYESNGLNTSFIYDTTVDEMNRSSEEMKFDNYTEQDIVELVENKYVINPSMRYCTSTLTTEIQAGYGMKELIDNLMKEPDVGMPLNNVGINTVTRGARLGCLFMRSLPQGGGKSRLAAGDACNIAVPYVWDLEKKEWKYTGHSEPVLYITTEMTVDQIQTICNAAVSKVNEEHILFGEYVNDEYERVDKATQYVCSSPIYIVHIPDFNIEDIKNVIKKYNREFGVKYVFFDYIMNTLRLMTEVNNKSRVGLKEHQLLLVFATELKTLAQQLDIFIYTASQMNGEARNATYKDQNLLAGSKALSNKLDVGLISMDVVKADLKKLDPILKKRINEPKPNYAHYIYKVRRGRLTRLIIWCYIDLGIMTERPLFVTDYDFNLIDIDFTEIEVVENIINDNSVPISELSDEVSDEETSEIVYDTNGKLVF